MDLRNQIVGALANVVPKEPLLLTRRHSNHGGRMQICRRTRQIKKQIKINNNPQHHNQIKTNNKVPQQKKKKQKIKKLNNNTDSVALVAAAYSTFSTLILVTKMQHTTTAWHKVLFVKCPSSLWLLSHLMADSHLAWTLVLFLHACLSSFSAWLVPAERRVPPIFLFVFFPP